ncbi:hypothetical protein NEUTE2DRAFT_91697, partial [Neurospora tetrasperma FGSC 2509]
MNFSDCFVKALISYHVGRFRKPSQSSPLSPRWRRAGEIDAIFRISCESVEAMRTPEPPISAKIYGRHSNAPRR